MSTENFEEWTFTKLQEEMQIVGDYYGEDEAWNDHHNFAPSINELYELQGRLDLGKRILFEGYVKRERDNPKDFGVKVKGFTVFELSFVEMLELIVRYRGADDLTVETTGKNYSIRCWWD